jgi:hypothetical protein
MALLDAPALFAFVAAWAHTQLNQSTTRQLTNVPKQPHNRRSSRCNHEQPPRQNKEVVKFVVLLHLRLQQIGPKNVIGQVALNLCELYARLGTKLRNVLMNTI